MAERVDSGTDRESADVWTPSNVLVPSPAIGAAKRDACHELLARTPPASTSVLAIGFTARPAEWIRAYEAHAGGSPVRGGFVAVGEADPSVDNPAWTVDSVDSPGDLTGLGVTLSDRLTAFAEATDPESESIVVCFDSITSLLQYADIQRAFQFLHVVTNRVAAAGGVGHYHVDPDAHGEQDMATLKGLFDAVAEVGDDGRVDLHG